MTYRGKVKGGVIVVEGQMPPEGADVVIEVTGPAEETLSQKLKRFSGVVKGMPSDMARNHGQYKCSPAAEALIKLSGLIEGPADMAQRHLHGIGGRQGSV